MNEICILIPTFEPYRPVARFTCAKLDEHWPGHPPIFLCGLAEQGDGLALLPLRDDPADWMALARSAVADLQARGFRRCYLVLDDHPPMDSCHARHLNETLPRLMEQLGASFINLQGWGQHRLRHGQVLGSEFYDLENPALDYLWKFTLHPGLWDLGALGEILDALLLDPDPRERTCWKFERRAGRSDFALPEHLRDSAYRICGAAMTARRFHARFRQAEMFVFDVLRFFIRVLGGQQARDRFDARCAGIYHYYEGPYPLFWSGLMKKGRLNNDLVFFFQMHRRSAQLAELRQAIGHLEFAAA